MAIVSFQLYHFCFAHWSPPARSFKPDEENAIEMVEAAVLRLKQFQFNHGNRVSLDVVSEDGFELGLWAKRLRGIHQTLVADGLPWEKVKKVQGEEEATKIVSSSSKHKQGGIIDVVSFVEAAEDESMEEASVRDTYLTGHSQAELVEALIVSARLLSPVAVRLAATEPPKGGSSFSACASATDETIKQLLADHQLGCGLSTFMIISHADTFFSSPRAIDWSGVPVGFFYRFSNNTGVDPGSNISFCGERCSRLLEDELGSVRSKVVARGNEIKMADTLGVFSHLCSPVLKAIIDACGQRKNVSVASFILDYARSGDVEAIRGLLRQHYGIQKANYQCDAEEDSPAALLASFGHIDEVCYSTLVLSCIGTPEGLSVLIYCVLCAFACLPRPHNFWGNFLI